MNSVELPGSESLCQMSFVGVLLVVFLQATACLVCKDANNNVLSDGAELDYESLSYRLTGGASELSVVKTETCPVGNLIVPSEITMSAGCYEIPVTSLHEGAFEGCSELLSVHIPGSVTKVGASAFNGCSELSFVGYCGIGPVTSDGNAIFDGCDALAKIHVSEFYSDGGFAGTEIAVVKDNNLDCTMYTSGFEESETYEPVPSASPEHRSTGVMVGAVIGVAVFLVISGILTCVCMRCRSDSPKLVIHQGLV